MQSRLIKVCLRKAGIRNSNKPYLTSLTEKPLDHTPELFRLLLFFARINLPLSFTTSTSQSQDPIPLKWPLPWWGTISDEIGDTILYDFKSSALPVYAHCVRASNGLRHTVTIVGTTYDCDQAVGNVLVPSNRKVALTEPKLTTSPLWSNSGLSGANVCSPSRVLFRLLRSSI